MRNALSLFILPVMNLYVIVIKKQILQIMFDYVIIM